MLLAFGWWTILLHNKNRDAFLARTEILKLTLIARQQVTREGEFLHTQDYLQLESAYKRQEWMIIGEACVFIVSLLIGVSLINRGYGREIQAARQSRNFLLSVTHELKSPIAGIRLAFETLQRRKVSAQQAETLVSNAISDTDRLNDLVSDLLLSARLESSFQLSRTSFSFPSLLSECTALLRRKFPEATIREHFADHLPDISADMTALRSVIMNLLENAVKYSPAPASIDVNLRLADGHYHLQVADEGLGIPPGETRNIFRKFYRLGNEDVRKTRGTGLGLYIVDQMVRAHEGQISVGSNSPKGSVFEVILPLPS